MSMHLPLSQIAQVLNCQGEYSDAIVTGAVIDSRKVESGNLFIALAGTQVDGHAYLAMAREAGAAAALVSTLQDDPLPQLLVSNVVKAFGELASYWRQQCHVKLVAVTGSNGKTTLKEMIAAILRHVGKVVSTQGNLNNELGVPLTLCRLSQDDDFAVIEMGANHAGEIANLVKMATPDVAVINNVAAAHLEGFGSLEGVARAKGEIFSTLTEGVGVVNADMAYLPIWHQLLEGKTVRTFALESAADVTASDIQCDVASSHFMVSLDGVSHYVNLPVPGKHNIANALAAIAVTSALQINPEAIVKGLAGFKGVARRLQLRHGCNDSQLIDDTYNANPGSFQQALNTLAAFSGQHWLVLGDFGELGTDVKQIHSEMGSLAKQSGVDRLLTVGTHSQLAAESFGADASHFDDVQQLQTTLEKELNADVTCLIKGSRFMQLDKLADALAQAGEA